MTQIEAQIAQRIAKYPHFSPLAAAISFGRNDAFNGYKSDAASISNQTVRESYEHGYRIAKAEMRLDADAEWDN